MCGFFLNNQKFVMEKVARIFPAGKQVRSQQQNQKSNVPNGITKIFPAV